jgi:hypothetical protein
MWMHIIVEQKNLLGQQTSTVVVNHGLQPSDHKKQIPLCCSTVVQFKSGASIFKEDL